MPACAETPPAPAPGDLVIDPATMPENRHHLIPRFADPVWPVTFTSRNPSAAELRLHWATFPDRLREQFRLAAWALLNFPVPDRALALRGAAMRPRLSTLRLYQTVTNWRTFATWLDAQGITGLAQASTQVLTDYSIYLARTRKVSRNTAINHLVALTRLHAYGPHLPAEARIGVPAWDSEGLDDYLPAATAAGENATEPISPATMGPLLVWALKFTKSSRPTSWPRTKKNADCGRSSSVTSPSPLRTAPARRHWPPTSKTCKPAASRCQPSPPPGAPAAMASPRSTSRRSSTAIRGACSGNSARNTGGATWPSTPAAAR